LPIDYRIREDEVIGEDTVEINEQYDKAVKGVEKAVKSFAQGRSWEELKHNPPFI